MTIQNPQTCLSAELLRQLSHDELSPEELKDVEDHVSDCERCRQLLEVPQSDSQWQDEIVPILRTPLESPHVAGDHDERGCEGESLESILRLLGPTDDPHMLGRIGSYEVVGVIGRGGMGVVFKAYEGALNRFVAIKMLLPHLAASGAARKRFAREGKAAAAVIDDNVMPIYSVAEWQGVPYLVTQYSRGATLEKRIRDQGPLELKEILRIGMQTARGLAAAHAQGLVHRDVKPSNILLDGTVERALLTDFGLARAVDDASITRTGIIAGTPQYMSPEQARGGSVDARSDLFGLGCVLYAMCTGRPPFRADSSYAILRMITDDEPRSIREVNPDIPEWLCLLILRLMAKSPDARFGNALEVAALLEQCLAHVQQPTSVPLPASLVPHSMESFMKSSEPIECEPRIPWYWAVALLIPIGVVVVGSTFALLLLYYGGSQPLPPEARIPVTVAFPISAIASFWLWRWALQSLLMRLAQGQQPTSIPLPASLVNHVAGRRSIFTVTRKGVLAMLGTIGMTLLGMALWQATEAPEISGQWTSDEWGTVVLEAKGSGEYEGTFTGTGSDKPATDDPARLFDGGALLRPVPDIAIRKGKSGTVRLKWSRVERRFNGTWRNDVDPTSLSKELIKKSVLESKLSVSGTQETADDRTGRMSLRLVDNEIRGAWTTSKDAQRKSGTPRLADLTWIRTVLPQTRPVENEAKAAKRSTSPKSAHIGGNVDSVMVVHDDVDPHYAFYYPGEFGTSSSGSQNTQSLSWMDEGSITLKGGRTFGYHRESTDPFHLRVNGKEYDLRQGRVLELRSDDSVEQLKLFPTLSTANTPAALAKLITSTRGMNEEPFTLEKTRLQLEAAEAQLRDLLKTHAPTHALVVEVSRSVEALQHRIKELTKHPGGAAGEAAKPLDRKDLDPKSLSAAAKRFNSDTAEVRSKIFAPPIPDLTVERLCEGFRQSATYYRGLGKRQVADALEKIAVSGELPNEAIGDLIGSDFHAQDKMGRTISRQVVPALFLPDDTTSTGRSLVVLRPLELIYRKDGPVSKDYGDQFAQGTPMAPGGEQPLDRKLPPFAIDEDEDSRGSDSPQILMKHIADCQTRGDDAGVLRCWTDQPIKQLATTYLLMSIASLDDFETNTEAKRPAGYEDQMTGLKELLRDEVKDLQAIKPLIAHPLTQQVIKELGKDFAVLGNATTNSPSVKTLTGVMSEQLADPRRFVKKFRKVVQTDGGPKDNEKITVFDYRIELTDDKALATHKSNRWIMGLIKTQSGWQINEPWREADAKSVLDAKNVPGLDETLDRNNARAVVEAFVVEALARDGEAVKTLTRGQQPEIVAAPFLDLKIAGLPIQSVYVNDVTKPTRALATSDVVKLEGRDGFLVFSLSMSDFGWFITDIHFESEESAERELKKFLEANPKSISVPRQANSEAAKSATGSADAPPNTKMSMSTRVKLFTTGDGKKVACSPDGKLIAVASGGKAFPAAEGWKRTVEILDAETGKTAVSISLTTQDEDALLAATEGPRDFEVGTLAFSPDGTLLAVGTGLGQVKLFESRTGKLVLSLDDEAARLADQKTPEKLKSLKRAMGSVGSLAFSPSGKLLATSGGSFDDAAPNWGGVHELGELATGPGRLKVWAVQSGTLRNDLVGHSHANAVAFSADGAYLASVGSWQGGGGSDHGSGVILWAPNTGIKLRTFPVNTNGGTWSVAFSPKDKLMAISSRTFDKDNDTSTSSICLLRTATGILEWKQTVSGWGHPVAFTPDGKSVGVLCGGEAIRFFDTETGTLKHHLGLADPWKEARWNDFALLSQGRLAIAGADNLRQGKVEIWDFTGPNIKASAIEKPLDRHNARAVVEAFVAAMISGDYLTAKTIIGGPPPYNTMELFGDLAQLPVQSVYVNDSANPTRALATSELFKFSKSDQRGEFMVYFRLSMRESGWILKDILWGSEEHVDRELKKFLEANPNAISVPPQGQAQPRAARVNPLVGHWKLVKLADMPVDQLAGATVVIDEHRFKMHVPSQKGLYADWRYSLGANGDLDLFDADDAKGESTSRAKYSLKGKALCLALNAKKADLPRPVSATGEVPQEGVQYIVLESDEEAQSSEAAKAPDAGRGTREGHPQAPEQPALSKTLKQLQGEWRVTRQIHANGEEEGRSGNSILEFNGNRIVKHGGEPGDAMLIQADESHSPVRVEIALGSTQDSVLGLLSVEGDMLILCYGKHQKTPAPESRPEKLQWVSGVWYMELQRVKPGETIVPLKPKSQSQPQAAPSNQASPNAISVPSQASSEAARPATAAPLKVADTGKLELEVKEPEKLPPEKEPFTAWGKEVGGLQAGFCITNADDIHISGNVKAVVKLRNVSKETISASAVPLWVLMSPPKVVDSQGKPVRTTDGPYPLLGFKLKQLTLKPSEAVDVDKTEIPVAELNQEVKVAAGKVPDRRIIHVEPGKYKVNWTESFVQEHGELATGTVEFEVKAAKEPFTAWGKEVGGLQAGYCITNANDIHIGGRVNAVVKLRNVSKETISVSAWPLWFVSPDRVVDSLDQSVRATNPLVTSFEIIPAKLTLKPGQTVDVGKANMNVVALNQDVKVPGGMVSMHTIHVEPGKYKVNCIGFVQEHSALGTGTVEFEVKAVEKP